MFNNFKKTAVAVLALSSSAVFAGTMGPVCTPGNVTVPCPRPAWGVGVQALYLDTTFSNGNALFAGNGLAGLGGAGNGAFQDGWNSRWNWGFRIEGSYYFNTGNDLTVNWVHLDNNRGDDRRRNGGGNNLNRRGPRWDAVNIELGQHVDFSEWAAIRLHGGFQFARIADRRRNNNGNGFGAGFGGVGMGMPGAFPAAIAPVPALPPGVAFGPFLGVPGGLIPQGVPGFIGPIFGGVPGAVNPALFGLAANELANGNEARFNGFGPRLGADLSYVVGDGFSVYADGATTVLVGSSRPAFRFDPAIAVNRAFVPFFPIVAAPGVGGAIVPMNPFVAPAGVGAGGLGAGAFGNGNRRGRTILVPQLEGKLGAKYTYAMAQGDLTFDVGYLWVNYFNARHTVTSRGTFVDGFGFRRHLGFDANESNVGFNGPYAGLKWVGNLI